MSKVQSRDNMIDTMSNVQQFQKSNIHQFDIKVECKAVKGHFQLYTGARQNLFINSNLVL